MIYLDHNSTTDIHPEVLKEMKAFRDYGPLNPSSLHANGRKARSLLEDSRRNISYLLGIDHVISNYRITFTSSGTEANNLIITNFKECQIFISSTEHLSIYEYNKYLPNVTLIKVDENGVLDLVDLEEKLNASPKGSKKLLSVMLANNETGVINPIKRICEIAHAYNVLVHSDCIQAIGKIDVNMFDLNLDFITISGHKFGAPMGSAALISKDSIHLDPQIIGGGQEKSLRSGTENVPAIFGLGLAAKLVKDNLYGRQEYMSGLRLKLENMMLENFKNIEIIGINTKRLPNTSLICNLYKKAEIQLIALDLKGVCVSSGSACSSGKTTPSYVLSAMGYSKDKVSSAIRLSVGMTTTEYDINKFIEIYNEVNK